MTSQQGKTHFAPVPLRAMSDQKLTALDHRVLQCVAFHDRMSLKNRRGQGCWAGKVTMAKEANCDVTSLASSLSRLVERNYLIRERKQSDRRRTVYRVIHEVIDFSGEKSISDDESSEQVSSEERAGEKASHGIELSVGIQEVFRHKYIPQSGERNSVKTIKRNSVETAHLEPSMLTDAIGEQETTAVLSRLDRALAGMPVSHLPGWIAELQRIGEVHYGTPVGGHARRLLDNLCLGGGETESRECNDK